MHKNLSKKTLIANFTSLSFVQILNYVFPLLLIPYIVRVIGPSKYGVFAFSVAIAGYFAMLTDWGINLYAPREIAFIKNDLKRLSSLVSNILYLKFGSVLIMVIVYVIAVLTVPKFRVEKTLFLFTTTYIIMSGTSLNWFFQGIEKMAHIAVSQFLTKILWAIFIIVLIRSERDYIKLPLIYFSADFAGKIYLFWYIFRRWKIRLLPPEKQKFIGIIKGSFPLFISNISIRIYTGINTVFLGFLTTNAIVGYYTLAERIIKALLGVQSQISTVFYPHISAKLKISLEKATNSIKQGATSVMLMAIPLFLLSFIFSRRIIILVGGEKFIHSILTFKILSFLFLIVGLSNVFGVQILLPFGKRKEFMKATLFSVFINVGLDLILIPISKQNGAALSFVFSEIAVLIFMFYEYVKLKKKLIDQKTFLKFLFIIAVCGLYFLIMNLLGVCWFIEIGLFGVLYIGLTEILGLISIRRKTIPV